MQDTDADGFRTILLITIIAMADVAFMPLTIRGLTLKNRFIKAATHDGASFEDIATAYCRLAKNGVALLTVAYVGVSCRNKTFDNQHHIAASNLGEWSALVNRVRADGGALSAQLHHPGLFCMASTGQPIGPSFSWLPSKLAWPHVMTVDELHAITQEYVAAARLCVAAGFAAIELHCGHGYLLSQFLSPLINRRRDGYGGGTMARARFPTEVLRAVRDAVGAEFPLLIKMNADDGFAGGMRIDEAVIVARLLADAGADAIVPSFGYTALNGFGMLRGDVPLSEMAQAMPKGSKTLTRVLGRCLVPTIPFESTFLLEHAKRFVAALAGTQTVVIYVGGADSLASVQQVLSMGCAAVQLGRPLLREPWYVRRLEAAYAAQQQLQQQQRPQQQQQQQLDVYLGDVEDVALPPADLGVSKCVRCNRCTLAAIDPVLFPSGCPLTLPGEGRQYGDATSELT